MCINMAEISAEHRFLRQPSHISRSPPPLFSFSSSPPSITLSIQTEALSCSESTFYFRSQIVRLYDFVKYEISKRVHSSMCMRVCARANRKSTYKWILFVAFRLICDYRHDFASYPFHAKRCLFFLWDDRAHSPLFAARCPPLRLYFLYSTIKVFCCYFYGYISCIMMHWVISALVNDIPNC